MCVGDVTSVPSLPFEFFRRGGFAGAPRLACLLGTLLLGAVLSALTLSIDLCQPLVYLISHEAGHALIVLARFLDFLQKNGQVGLVLGAQILSVVRHPLASGRTLAG